MLGTDPVAVDHADADAGPHLQLVLAQPDALGQQVEHPAGAVGGAADRVVGRQVAEHDRELVADQPADRVRRADRGREPARGLLDQGVAQLVPEAVVDVLELAELDLQHADRVGRGGAGQPAVDLVEHPAPGGQPGERVEQGRVRERGGEGGEHVPGRVRDLVTLGADDGQRGGAGVRSGQQRAHRVGQGEVGGERRRLRRRFGGVGRGERTDQITEAAQGATGGVVEHGSAQRDLQHPLLHSRPPSPRPEAASAYLLHRATHPGKIHLDRNRPTGGTPRFRSCVRPHGSLAPDPRTGFAPDRGALHTVSLLNPTPLGEP